jgi:hypothetical protein
MSAKGPARAPSRPVAIDSAIVICDSDARRRTAASDWRAATGSRHACSAATRPRWPRTTLTRTRGTSDPSAGPARAPGSGPAAARCRARRPRACGAARPRPVDVSSLDRRCRARRTAAGHTPETEAQTQATCGACQGRPLPLIGGSSSTLLVWGTPDSWRNFKPTLVPMWPNPHGIVPPVPGPKRPQRCGAESRFAQPTTGSGRAALRGRPSCKYGDHQRSSTIFVTCDLSPIGRRAARATK